MKIKLKMMINYTICQKESVDSFSSARLRLTAVLSRRYRINFRHSIGFASHSNLIVLYQ